MDQLHAGRPRRRVQLAGVLLLAVCIAAGFAAGDAAAKKKKKGPAVFAQSVTANVAIPDKPPANAHETEVLSTLTVGKKFKGKSVGDVNVTGIQTTGNTSTAAGGLEMALSAPNGRTVLLQNRALGGQNIGPLTLDDDTTTEICDSTTLSCSDPNATLLRPFAGTANLINLGGGGTGPLAAFNRIPMKGTWTFRIWDNTVGGTNVLNTWGLRITPLKPVTK